MAIYSFKGFTPVIKSSSFVHPQANVTGNVIIGENVYVGPGAVLRGDWGQIIVEDGCNIQENCVIHMFPGTTVHLKAGAHIGHGAIIHGGIIEENCLIGMNAVIMDEVIVGKESIVGALSYVASQMHIPSRSIAVGNPAKIIKQVTDKMLEWKTQGTALYQQLAVECHNELKSCEPLKDIEPDRPVQQKTYFNWQQSNEQSDNL